MRFTAEFQLHNGKVKRATVRRRQFGAGLLALLGTAPAATVAAREQQLLLEVVRNGFPVGKIGEFIDRDGDIFATADELRSLGVSLPSSVQGEVRLRSVPGLQHERDDAKQQLRFTANNSAFVPNELGPTPSQYGAPVSGWGGLINYDLLGTSVGGRTLGAGFFEGRAFSPYGILTGSMLGYSERTNSQSPAIRLDTAFVYDDVDSMRRYSVGDFISGGLAWTRPIRMGGFQVASNFGIRPDLVTFPVPTIGGSAAVPSSVDVLVNGVRQFSGTTEPGPFAVRQLPIFTGAGEVAVVVRDALGRETTSRLPFYATGSLLASGFAAYSGEVGLVRRNYGLRSHDYSHPAFNGTLRYGLNDWLTAETHGEFASNLAMGGGGFTMAIGTFGVASAAAAASTPRSALQTSSKSKGSPGWQVSAGFERVTRRFTAAGSVILASRDFTDLAGIAGTPAPRRVLRASVGLPLGKLGTVALAVADIRQGVALESPDFGIGYVGDATIGSLTYTNSIFNRATLYGTAFKDFNRNNSFGAIVGVSFALNTRTAANITAGNDASGNYASLQANQSATSPGEWGWRLYDTEGALKRQLGEVEYRAQWARMTAGVDHTQNTTAVRTGIQGSLSTMGGGLYASNLIQDSFAVVDTSYPSVAVLQENRPVGQTDSRGRLLVPGLRSYDNNRLAIGTENLPIDATVGQTSEVVRPLNRSGVLVRFPVTRGSSARIHLVDAAGRNIPVGSIATFGATGSIAPVGHGGETFFEGLAARNQLSVTLPDGKTCQARVDFAPTEGDLPLLGPIPCR